MDCQRYQADLSAVAAGSTLAPERQRALAEHLKRCPPCATRIERQRRALEMIDRALAEGADAVAPPELVRRIERQFAEPPQPALRVGALAAAAAALALATGTWLLHSRFRLQPRQPAASIRAGVPAPPSVRSSHGIHGSPAPLVAAGRIRPGPRPGRRRTLPPDERIFVLARFPAEKEAVDRLYQLLENRQIDARSLRMIPANGNENAAPAGLAIRPLVISPLETDSLAGGAGEPRTNAGFPQSDTNARKETKR